MQLCGVCNDQIPKYRCPVCRVKYCSLGCFKKHKSDDSCQLVIDTARPATTVATAFPDVCQSSAEQPWTVDDLLDEDSQSDKVPLPRLQQLGESETLMSLLRNPHLRQLMLMVDSAQDKAQAMKKAMQEPLFVEFADQCLQIIEPTEKEAEEIDDGY
ncbi:zinc finger HIT domain-containing protein 3 [Electrophorus electricus]|uniref:Zinc finger HIT domain-containing protein 3 n=1 Tax=Electrophorus electricus TaxID=8005 RepID=A0A4W4HK88_ELEEL|nr:zinc finger HIT domain-containing protein 3 [Electrophorus electricus]